MIFLVRTNVVLFGGSCLLFALALLLAVCLLFFVLLLCLAFFLFALLVCRPLTFDSSSVSLFCLCLCCSSSFLFFFFSFSYFTFIFFFFFLQKVKLHFSMMCLERQQLSHHNRRVSFNYRSISSPSLSLLLPALNVHSR